MSNTLSWEDVFSEVSAKNWGRRTRELLEGTNRKSEPFFRLTDGVTTEIRLDWLVHMGGPLRHVFDQYCLTRSGDPNGIDLSIAMAPDPVLIFEIQSWLKEKCKKGSTFRLHADERWRSHLIDTKVPTKFERRPFGDRSFESTDRFLRFLWQGLALSSAQSEALMKASRQQVLQAADTDPPWIISRKIATWLKFYRELAENQTRFSQSEIFEIERRGSLVAAFLSPQDEEQESKSLEPRALMLNPTLEVLVRPSGLQRPLLVVGRYRDSMFEHDLNLVEAAVMEFVRESFRAQEASVCLAVAAELGAELEPGSPEIYQSVQRLKFEGLILTSDFQQNL